MPKKEWKGGALLAPLPPTMVSCALHDGKPNILTVAWTGILATKPPRTYISVRPERYSHDMIRQSGVFVINLPSAALIRAADYCGMKTGRKVDKFKDCSLTPEYIDGFDCPAIAEAPLSVFCRVERVIPLDSHDMFLATIERVLVDESLLDQSGALHMEKAGLAAFAHGDYFALGKKIGSFGFSVAKKRKYPVANKQSVSSNPNEATIKESSSHISTKIPKTSSVARESSKPYQQREHTSYPQSKQTNYSPKRKTTSPSRKTSSAKPHKTKKDG